MFNHGISRHLAPWVPGHEIIIIIPVSLKYLFLNSNFYWELWQKLSVDLSIKYTESVVNDDTSTKKNSNDVLVIQIAMATVQSSKGGDVKRYTYSHC